MGERVLLELLLVALLVVGLWGARLAFRWWQRQATGWGSPLSSRDRPRLLYFTTPHCAQCRLAQEPELDSLLRQYPERLELIKVNALEERELAVRYRVVGVPTTIVVGQDGRPWAINNGVASASRLAAQLGLDGAEPESEPLKGL